MENNGVHTVEPAAAGETLILLETDSYWVVAPKLDARLEPGAAIIYQDQLWSITWTSDMGFGEAAMH
jgi:hypothetical protein